MTYHVKEIYYTLQGEGAQSGRAAVFLRFAGCNLWSGREEDRPEADCQFCDTDFVGTDGPGGGKFDDPDDLADYVATYWTGDGQPYVVCTGGEPMLQLDGPLISALKDRGFEVGVETNGTIALPLGLDWICVSPKAGTSLKQTWGDELKVVYPQAGLAMDGLVALNFSHFFIQPMDGPAQAVAIKKSIQYCLDNPQWRISLQTHKMMGID